MLRRAGSSGLSAVNMFLILFFSVHPTRTQLKLSAFVG